MNFDRRVPFGDLGAEVREIRPEIDQAIARVLDSGWFVLGKEGEQFEVEFARYVGAGSAVGCANGTDAITLALKALGLGRGDEVITVANTCVPTATGIVDANCSLRLVDCDPDTLQMDPDALRKSITSRTRAVIPVHLYGACPDMDAIQSICRERGVALIEDCAQAHGAALNGVSAGGWGDLACWSFYPSKNLGAYGDGGAVTGNDPDLTEKITRLRNYGQRVRYHHDEAGRNSRLDELQAAILRVKLTHLDRWNEQRREIAEIYEERLDGAVTLVTLTPGCLPVRHLFPVRVPRQERDQIRARIHDAGIDSQIHYPVPLHLQKVYASSFADQSYPAAESAAGELITLPLYPQLSHGSVHRVADALLTSLGKQTRIGR